MTRLADPSAAERELKLKLRLAQLAANDACRDDFLTFVRKVWPDFIAGRHHKIIAEKLERVARGESKRLIINMAPRHTKSEFASFLFPAWFMGRDPKKKIIQATHTTALAVNFGFGQQGEWSVGHEQRWDVLRCWCWFELGGSWW